MPKAFSQTEKNAIKTTLMEIGLKHFTANGIRKVRVGDICNDVGIAKGSFYAFFASKEDLFMSIANQRDAAHKADMRKYLISAHGTPREILAGFFAFLMDRIETDPILKIMRDTGEVNHLIRKASPELLAENTERDKAFMHEVAEIFQTRHNLPFADYDTLTGLMTLMLSMALQAEHISAAGTYPAVTALMRDLFITRLLKGPLDDQG